MRSIKRFVEELGFWCGFICAVTLGAIVMAVAAVLVALPTSPTRQQLHDDLMH